MDWRTYEIGYTMLQAGCIRIDTTKGFRWTSGNVRPTFVDIRRLISFPDTMRCITQGFAIKLDRLKNDNKTAFTKVAGGETAGIPFAAHFACQEHVPMVYVRKEPNRRGEQIEGVLTYDDVVVLFEDLASEGSSKRKFVETIRKTGARIQDACVVFSYDLPSLRATCEGLGITLHSLVTWEDIFAIALQTGKWTIQQIDVVRAFLDDPDSFQPQS